MIPVDDAELWEETGKRVSLALEQRSNGKREYSREDIDGWMETSEVRKSY